MVRLMLSRGVAFVFVAAALGMGPLAWEDEPDSSAKTATGVVFHDQNHNGERDDGEPGIAEVRVSNGKAVTRTDDAGRYTLPVEGDTVLFVCKPRGWIYPVDDLNLPQFYYLHKPEGSPDDGFKFRGSEPTGPLPGSVNFPLHKHEPKDKFRAVFLGDPQPGNIKEVRYFGRDIMTELVGVDASFGVTLGDIVGDDLSLFRPMNERIALAGVPWHAVIGNHDINFHAAGDKHANETFERVYGPANYASQYGKVHLIALDNVFYKGERSYHGEIRDRQLGFVKNYLATVPKNHRIVIATHIPLRSRQNAGTHHVTNNTEELMKLLSEFPHTASFSAHTHLNAIYYLDSDDGDTPSGHSHEHDGAHSHDHAQAHGVHVHHNLGTTSGSWWQGPLDERGIPMTPMADGTPNGYAMVTFDGPAMRVRWKVANRPADHQMRIIAPDHIDTDQLGSDAGEVLVNVFNGGPGSTVKMRVPGQSEWVSLERAYRKDPLFAKLHELDQASPMEGTERLTGPKPSTHLWSGVLPEGLAEGTHLIEVKATDAYGHTFTDNRPIRVQ